METFERMQTCYISSRASQQSASTHVRSSLSKFVPFSSYGILLSTDACTLKVIILVGPPLCGKSTLLRLFATDLFPQSGVVLVPTHLRVLHVMEKMTMVLFDITLMENLCVRSSEGERNDPKSKLAIPIFFYQTRQTFSYIL